METQTVQNDVKKEINEVIEGKYITFVFFNEEGCGTVET